MDRSIVGNMVRWGTAVAIVPLAGCASFDGTPHPVMGISDMVMVAQNDVFGFEAASSIAKLPLGTSGNTREYRDAFLAVQMAAIDAQYFRFRRDLTGQAKGANFGLDLGILGLTGAGSIAGERAANILSAGGAALTGAKASLNKEVYFEKTLPAIVASMDARRLTLKTAFVAKMGKPIGDYSVSEAMIDMSTYQLSASIDAAIEQITGDANAQKEAATQAYANLVPTCVHPEPAAIAVSIGIRAKLDALDTTTGKATLDTVAYAMHVPVTDSFADEKGAIVSAFGAYPCTVAAAKALSASLSSSTNGVVQ